MSRPIPEVEARQSAWLEAAQVRELLRRLFAAAGLSADAAIQISDALVEADLEGLPSHGVIQAEVYLERLRRGSVSTRDRLEIVEDRDAIAIADAHNMLGHISASQAMALAIEKAKRFGIAAVAVRHGFHIGAAGRYARQAAAGGCIGMVMANSRPVMPAPGGAQKLVGTNPIAFGIPAGSKPPIIVDMATSAGTVGRIRHAQKSGKEIPAGWALDTEGNPTTDATAALAGMLLPMGGPKGFGLALVIDLLCGLLASGTWGDDISGLHLELEKPFDTSHFFMAIDVEHFRPLAEFLDVSASAVKRVQGSKRAPNVDRVFAPGERRWEAAHHPDSRIKLEVAQIDGLTRLCAELGVDAAGLLPQA